MEYLFQILEQKVSAWQSKGYPCRKFPVISEILEFIKIDETGFSRFLRSAQIKALETYWYIRLIEKTPLIPKLYDQYYSPKNLLEVYGLKDVIGKGLNDALINKIIDGIVEQIKTDDTFVKNNRLQSVRETLTLKYPSYILALAMGAGKTILIGAIIATEFAMSIEYPDDNFIQNALVFAPGTTIIESLKEIQDIAFNKILPKRLCKDFLASFKLTFTREGEKTIPIIPGSKFNIIVTNTEKIRIQKRTVRKRNLSQIELLEKEKQEEEIANLRLQALASLPHLGIFSDEAHHTYGQNLEKGLKKVRKTVDYLNENTKLICVVNTTGTPYYRKQPLRDVVVWYGLADGINDNILKEVSGSIYDYSFSDEETDKFVTEVIQDFFDTYGDVTLPDGSPAKLALYFPQINDLNELRPVVEHELIKIGFNQTIVLKNTSTSSQSEIDDFNRLNDPTSQYRVILLVNKGTEGWNCPSLFATALARKLKTSNNFVLQASSRCLRQVLGNNTKARIYLSSHNRSILDKELQETYGHTLKELDQTHVHSKVSKIIVRKIDIPPLVIRQVVDKIVEKEKYKMDYTLTKPSIDQMRIYYKSISVMDSSAVHKNVLTHSDVEELIYKEETIPASDVATNISANTKVDFWELYRKLKFLYHPSSEVPASHLKHLQGQIESQITRYEKKTETVEKALALIKKEGFTKEEIDGTLVYTAEISYPINKEHLLLSLSKYRRDEIPDNIGFHYDPYNFDSSPEMDFFQQLLVILKTDPKEVDDIYFTGAITNTDKTDFMIEYKGKDGNWHNYIPDFVIRKKNGKIIIVEVKDEKYRDDEIDGEKGSKAMAVRIWEKLNPDDLKYEILFSSTDSIPINEMNKAIKTIENL